MHAVLRTYSGKGAKELFDVIEKNKTDVESASVGKGVRRLFANSHLGRRLFLDRMQR
jgi:hypothetical protein